MKRRLKLRETRGQTLFEYLSLLILVGGITIALFVFVVPRWIQVVGLIIKAVISVYTTSASL
ncbi:MAG: hypothetical protein LAO21_14190 [Acidobacteriia bacterium]|nr:hypothetical protein [Terriglobia bacterium]